MDKTHSSPAHMDNPTIAPHFLLGSELNLALYSSTPTELSRRYSLHNEPTAKSLEITLPATPTCMSNSEPTRLSDEELHNSGRHLTIDTTVHEDTLCNSGQLITPPATSASSSLGGNYSRTVASTKGKTALHIAAERGNAQIVQFLLASDVDADVADVEGRTPLHYAARAGKDATVALLIAAGADPEARDLGGQSPLHAAADADCESVVRLLAREGADLNAATGLVDN